MNAKTVWKVTTADFPANGPVVEKLGHILRIITRAAKMEDRQPCQYKLKDTCIELSGLPDATSESNDPDDRQLMIECGTALFRLKLALKHFGCLGAVELFPDLGNTRLVARLHYGGWLRPDSREIAMFEALTGTTKNFTPFGEAMISEIACGSLRQSIACENAWLDFSHCESSRRLLSELAEADGPSDINLRNAAGEASLSWGGVGHSRSAWWIMPFAKFNEPSGRVQAHEYTEDPRSVDEMGALAALKTKTDDRQGWLAAGLTRACVELQAQSSGMPTYFFDQAFQRKFPREELRTAMGRKGFVQTIVGLGTRPPGWKNTSSSQASVTITLRR